MTTHRIKLTDAAVSRIKPPTTKGQQDEYYDIAFPGFSLRVGTSGQKTFTLMYRYEGRQRRLKIGRYGLGGLTLAEARDKAGQALQQLEKGHDPSVIWGTERQENLRAPTIEVLVEVYLERHAKRHKRSWKEDQRILEKDVIPCLGKRKAKDIKRRDIIKLLDDIVDRDAPIAANRTLAVTRAMFNWAISRDIVETNPCHMIKAPGKETKRDRVLSVAEIHTFWLKLDSANMAPVTRTILRLQLLYALRANEVAVAKWDEFDFDTGWWTIPAERSKNKLDHRVPLTDLGIGLIQDHPRVSDYVFPTFKRNPGELGPMSKWGLSHAMQNNLEHFGIAPFTPHDLRRTASTHIHGMGVSPYIVDKILNHTDHTVRAVYDRYSYDKEKRQTLEAWEYRLKEIVYGEETRNVINIHG